MEILSKRNDEENDENMTAQQIVAMKLIRAHKIRNIKDLSHLHAKNRSRNKLENDSTNEGQLRNTEQADQDVDQDVSMLKNKAVRRHNEHSEQSLMSSQMLLKLPPIRGRQIEISEKRKDDTRIQRRELQSEEKEMVRSNSNSVTRINGQQSNVLNVKGLSVNTRQPKKQRVMLYKGSEQTRFKVPEQTEDRDVKEQLKKDITVIRKKKSAIKKEKRFTNSIHDFLFFINWTNRIEHNSEPQGAYKAWVGKGNNSILIKNTLKSRFWWNIVDSADCPDVNLVWTQSRDPKVIEQLNNGQQLLDCEPQLRHFQSESPITKQKTIIFEVPREKQNRNKTYYGQSVGLRKLASSKDLQNSKDNYSIEIEPVRLRQYGTPNSLKAHNHLQFNWNLSNKKALYYNLKTYYEALKTNPFDYIPVTFHIKAENDKEWTNFLNYYNSRSEDLKGMRPSQKDTKVKRKKERNVWIIKPGENSNRGCGIDVAETIQNIRDIVKNKALRSNGKPRTHIIQSYIMPFLYNKRKFDIRCYILITSVNGIMKSYWYEEGYIRTSCKQFTLKNLTNRMIHLTNDAVQKKSEDYGKFQNANKISFSDFQKYLDNTYPESNYNFSTQVYPNMIKLATDAVKSTWLSLDFNCREFTFEVFGLDFMIDQDFKVWLIEVNTNPCLELSSPLLARIIPSMIENALKIGLDPLFPPPRDWPKKRSMPNQFFQTNRFTLIFDSLEDGNTLKQVLSPTNLADVIEIEEESQIDDEDEQ